MEIGTLQVIVLVVVVIAAIPLLRLIRRHERAVKRERVAGRSDMEFAEFYRSFYAESGLPPAVVRRLLEEVAEVTDILAAKLRPPDRFDRELAPAHGDEFGDGLAILPAHVRRRLERAGLSADLGTIRTLDDFIRCLGRSEMVPRH